MKEERDEWLSTLNHVIKCVRLWDTESYPPCSQQDAEKYMK